MFELFPFVTVILPIRNESNFIARSLSAMHLQDYPSDHMEILVADGISTDKTREIVQAYQQNYPQIHIIDNPKKIVPTALNAAIHQAKGDIIIRIDGHTLIATDYIRKCVETLRRTGVDNVGGCMTAEGTTAFGKAVAIATSTPFGVGNSKFHYAQAEEETDSVYMGAWPKDLFRRIGLFDEELVRNQDDEFNYRLREKGGKIILNPEITSVYTTRSSPLTLWKQYFEYGLWKIRVLQKHPTQMSLRQFIPPLFVFGLLISILLTLTTNWGKWLLFFIVFSYLLANIAASIMTASKKGWKHLPLLPITFLIIHLSYGFGFLAGLIKFWNRWGDKKGKVPLY
jgi:glycosyltransferase involved in cell wall biosynthesis